MTSKSRDSLVKYGVLRKIEERVDGAKNFIEEAYLQDRVGVVQRVNNGKSEYMWRIWEAMVPPEVSGKALDELILRVATEETVLLGFEAINSGPSYETRLRQTAKTIGLEILVRLVATRSIDSRGGEKALMAVRSAGK